MKLMKGSTRKLKAYEGAGIVMSCMGDWVGLVMELIN
jgi:hypothetical protein